MAGRHRADGGDGYEVRGRDNRGVADGNKVDTNRESDDAGYSQALADQHAADHAQRQQDQQR